MTNYLATLRKTLGPTLLGLVVGCLIAGLILGLVSVPPTNFSNLVAGWSFGFFLALWAMAFGAIPAFAYGAPLYALARLRGRASILVALAIGLLPGVVFLITHRGSVVLLFGAVVGVCVHAFARRQMGANNSFKPKPLRGSA